eukprot:5946765-Amphidinium_carterae.1
MGELLPMSTELLSSCAQYNPQTSELLTVWATLPRSSDCVLLSVPARLSEIEKFAWSCLRMKQC